jgi:hypothetical protein
LGVRILDSDFAALILPPPGKVSTTFSLENFCCTSLTGQGISIACSHFYLSPAPVSSDIPLDFCFAAHNFGWHCLPATFFELTRRQVFDS